MNNKTTVGIEVECFVKREHISNGSYHNDGSVEVGGNGGDCDYSCRSECSCYDECDCDMCITCSECGESCCDCYCDECSTCDICCETLDCCVCIKAHRSTQGKNCDSCLILKFRTDHTLDESDMIACEDCIMAWNNNHRDVSCAQADNIDWNCDRECSCECNCECDCNSDGGEDGEIVSNIIKAEEIEKWFNDNEMAIGETNRSCGIHVHVGGLTMVEYGILMEVPFHLYLKTELLKWGEEMNIRRGSQFFQRLEGTNTYCRDKFNPQQQKMDLEKTSVRYCFVNYCWALHGTLEIRVLPSFQKHSLRSKAVDKVIDIIHSYINKNKPEIHVLKIKEVV
jgi:hypothetical protein